MLQDIQITNYRVFEKFALTGLKRVNLLVGSNNAGKTSLLEAIYLLASNNKSLGLTAIMQERGEFLADQDAGRGRFRSNQPEGYLVSQLFYKRNFKNKPIKIQSLSLPGSFTVSITNGGDEEGRSHHLVLQNDLAKAEQKAEQKPIAMKMADNILLATAMHWKERPQFGDARFMTVNDTDYTALAELWDEIVLTPGEDQAVAALRIIEPGVERISFTSGRTSHSGILVRLKGEEAPVPMDSMGDGMRRILSLIMALVSVQQSVLLIDEIDTGLYYGVLKEMWQVIIETATKQNAQVFATTHSWDCVKAFQQALSQSPYREDGLLIRLDRDKEQTQVTTYTVDELDIAISQGIEVR